MKMILKMFSNLKVENRIVSKLTIQIFRHFKITKSNNFIMTSV